MEPRPPKTAHRTAAYQPTQPSAQQQFERRSFTPVSRTEQPAPVPTEQVSGIPESSADQQQKPPQPRGLGGSPRRVALPSFDEPAMYSQPPAMNPSWNEPPSPAGGARGGGVPPLAPLPGTRGTGGSRFLPIVVSILVVLLLFAGAWMGYHWVKNGDDSNAQPNVAISGTGIAAAIIDPTKEADSTATAAASIATSPTARATTTPREATATPTPEKRATRTPTPRPASSTNIEDLLPTEDDVPADFEQTGDDTFTKQQVADALINPEDAAAKLDEWNWRAGVSRSFEIPQSAEPSNDQTTYLYVSIHRFARSADAANAIGYFADALAEARGLQEVTIDPLGNEVIALSGGDAGDNEVGLYIRAGSRLIRVTAYSVTGNPMDDAIALAEKVLSKS